QTHVLRPQLELHQLTMEWLDGTLELAATHGRTRTGRSVRGHFGWHVRLRCIRMLAVVLVVSGLRHPLLPSVADEPRSQSARQYLGHESQAHRRHGLAAS